MLRLVIGLLTTSLLLAGFAGCERDVTVGNTDGDADGDSDGDGDADGDGDGDSDVTVRTLVIMDQSASLQCTDPDMSRRTILSDVVAAQGDDTDARFAYVGFHAGIFVQEFTTGTAFETAANDFIIQLGPATDYQGALATAVDLLEADMAALPAEDAPNTRYEVLFVSDGVPEPVCTAGCEDGAENCADSIDNDGDELVDGDDPDCAEDQPDGVYGICNNDGAEAIPDSTYVDFGSGCPQYNSDDQILDKVDTMVALATTHGVAGLSLDTTFLFADQEVVESTCGGDVTIFGYVCAWARPLLEAMATRGGGTFINTSPDECVSPGDPTTPIGVPYECDDRFSNCGTP